MEANRFPFILIGTRSDNGMPMVMGKFTTLADAHEAMVEDFNSMLEDDEYCELSGKIGESKATLGEGEIKYPIRWVIENLDEVEC